MLRTLSWSKIVLILALFCLVQTLLLWPALDLPPVGQHIWRQVTGMAFARNYGLEGADFFFPRQDIRVGQQDLGLIYHEFPIVYWIVGKLYQQFGFHYYLSRIVALSVNFLGIFASYFLARGLQYSQVRSLAFSLFLSFSPLFLYYATTLLPDLTALNYFMMGMALLLYAVSRGEKLLPYAGGVIFVTLAILTKPSWIFYGLPVAAVLLAPYIKARRFPPAKAFIPILAAGLFILVLFYLQYAHSHKLYDQAPLERALHAQLKTAELPQSWHDIWRNLSIGIGTWFVEINVAWGGILFFLSGLWVALRSPASGRFSTLFWRLYALSFFIYGCFFVMRFGDHDYYLTASLPIAAMLSSRGFEAWLSHKKWRYLALVLALAFPVMSVYRIQGRWFQYRQVPVALLEKASEFQTFMPASDRVLVVGDKTPLVYLYYLDRRGIVYLPDLADIFPETLAKGDFKWLLVNSKSDVKVPPIVEARYSLSLTKQIDDLSLYRLDPRSAAEGN